MSLYSGVRSGLRVGVRSGLDPGGVITWDVDASSGYSFPSTEEQWDDFIAYHSLTGWSAPDSLFLFQEASGSIVDAIGSFDWASAGARQDYQVTGVGLTRYCARARGDEWFTTSASLPDSNASSTLMLTVCKHEAVGVSTKTLIGAATSTSVLTLAGGELRLSAGGATADGATDQTGVWIPMITQVNRNSTNSFAASLDTDVATAHGAISGKTELVSGGSTGASTLYAYAAVWRGANGERTPTQIKALQTALGFNPTWTP